MARKKLKTAAAVNVPQNDTELNVAVADLGAARARIDELTAIAEQAKSAIDAQLAVDTERDEQAVNSLQKGIEKYIEANRERLTPKGKKTITLISGTIEYRAGRLSISVSGAKAVIEGLEASGNRQFVKVTKSVNKDALLDHIREYGIKALPDVAGLKVKRGAETLEIKPNQINEDLGNV